MKDLIVSQALKIERMEIEAKELKVALRGAIAGLNAHSCILSNTVLDFDSEQKGFIRAVITKIHNLVGES